MLDWPRPGDRDRETTLKDGGRGGEQASDSKSVCVCGGGGEPKTLFSHKLF